MRHGIVLGLVAGAGVSIVHCAEPADPFEAKVRALAANRYGEREKAAQELEAAGEPALKALRAAAKSTDLELKNRAEAIAAKIERTILSKQLLVAPKLHIKLDKVPLNQAILEVSKLSGRQFMLHAGDKDKPTRPITLDTGEVPYWEAMQAFYDAAGVVETDTPPGQPKQTTADIDIKLRSQVMLGSRGSSVSRVHLVGSSESNSVWSSHALRIRAVEPNHSSNKFDAGSGEVTFGIAIDAAKGVELKEVIGIEVRKAIDEKGRSLASAYPPPIWQPYYYGDDALVVRQLIMANGEVVIDDGASRSPLTTVSLKTGTERPRTLKELHGTLVAKIVAPPQPLVSIANVFEAKGQSQSNDGVTLRVQSVEEGAANLATIKLSVVTQGEVINEVLNLPVQVKGRARPFLRINRGGAIASNSPSEFRVQAADGKPLRIVGTRINASSSDGVTMSQEVELKIEKPANGLKNATLALTARRPAVVEMPFVLTDVKLP